MFLKTVEAEMEADGEEDVSLEVVLVVVVVEQLLCLSCVSYLQIIG